jgi:glyoxylase-like metal-dependent hydrolase (beta-lactamase superfamily II)
MTELTRRTLFAGVAAATAATALTPPAGGGALAAAPPAGKQNPGWYRYKVGEFEVTVVTDGVAVGALPDAYVKNAPKTDVGAELAAMHLAPDKFSNWFNPLVVNTGSKLVLFDAGAGLSTFQQSKGSLGQFHSNLAAAGIDRNAIDAVIVSHFHGDHIGGLLDAENKFAFPNAELLMPALEIKFWTDANASRFPAPINGQFANVKRVLGALSAANTKITQYEGNKELVPGITLMHTPGHTPGHTSFVIASGSNHMIHQVDVTAGMATLFVRNPGWYFFFDTEPELAEQTRRKFYDMVITDKVRIHGYHIPFPSNGYIEKDGKAYRFVPAVWDPTI